MHPRAHFQDRLVVPEVRWQGCSTALFLRVRLSVRHHRVPCGARFSRRRPLSATGRRRSRGVGHGGAHGVPDRRGQQLADNSPGVGTPAGRRRSPALWPACRSTGRSGSPGPDGVRSPRRGRTSSKLWSQRSPWRRCSSSNTPKPGSSWSRNENSMKLQALPPRCFAGQTGSAPAPVAAIMVGCHLDKTHRMCTATSIIFFVLGPTALDRLTRRGTSVVSRSPLR